MDILLLAKILAALEWQNLNTHKSSIYNYIDDRYPEILQETSNQFNHIYLEV